MQVSFSQNIKNINNYPKIVDKRSYSSPVSFCGADVFERPAVEFSQEFCQKTIHKLLRTENIFDNSNKKLLSGLLAIMEELKKGDPELIKLNKLADNYKNKKTPLLEDKIILLKHEENMHWQELETPAIGLVRTFADMTKAGIKKDFASAMQISTINGLWGIKQAYGQLGVKFTPDEHHFNLLKNLIEKTPDGSPFAYDIKIQALTLASRVKKDDDSFVKLAEYVKENTNNEGLKIFANAAINGCSEYNELNLLSKLSNGSLEDFEKTDVIKTLVENESRKLTEQLPSMIQDKNTSQEVKNVAVWAAGGCKSSEDFDLLYKIANNKDEKNLETRELALHSLALYLKTNKPQVTETLNNVIKEKSELSELATILLEKSEGRYYRKDRELANLTAKEKALYKNLRDNFVKADFKLNIQQENILDRALSPLRKKLDNLVNIKSKIFISDDTYTKFAKEDVGIRQFSADPAYGGDFCDSMTGVAYKKMVLINKNFIKGSNMNVPAHEYNHVFLHKCLSREDKKTVTTLYKNAVKQNRCLDAYAKLSESEYFAQGYEAYTSIYKSGFSLIENNNFNVTASHVRSTLKRKDPGLYDFIEYCIKKYNS